MNISDPSTWPALLSAPIRSKILCKGPVQIKMAKFPKTNNVSFSSSYYVKQLPSGEIQDREWLIYSQTTDSLFCFACSLFSTVRTKSLNPWAHMGNGNSGFKDFHHLRRSVARHEESQQHFESIICWKQYMLRSKAGQLIDQKEREELQKEAGFWREVLRSLIEAILFLAKNNLAFRGSSTEIDNPNCGNYLSLVKLLSKYHSPLALHVNRLKSRRISYMSPKIQNEFIQIAATSVRKSILKDILSRKYFSIMFDATPDTSHMEQISQVIRSVQVSTNGCSIEEHFIDFFHCDEKTGLLISEAILEKLEKDGLKLEDCRGQGYDNGSNMAGAYKGVQARIMEKNPLATFVPCAAHSLNLVGHHAATKCLPAKLILGQIQNLYMFFSASPSRWSTLKKHCSSTLKGQSSTRWSSKAIAVGILFEEFENISESLKDLLNSETSNAQTLADALSHFNQISNFKFILGITIWNLLLNRIN